MHDPTASDDTAAAHAPTASADVPTPILIDEPPRRRGRPVLAWLGILLIVGLAVFFSRERPLSPEPGSKERIAPRLMGMQGRHIVGPGSLGRPRPPSVYQQAPAPNVRSG